MEGWIGEQRGKFLEMSAQVLILKSLDNSLTHFFTHQAFLKDLLEGAVAGARVNWEANANSFPTGPLGLLNHSALAFRLPSMTGLGSHVSFIQQHSVSPPTYSISQLLVLAPKNLRTSGSLCSSFTCPHPDSIHSLVTVWSLVETH